MPSGASSPGLSPTDFSSAVNAITAAFGDPTRRRIYLFVHEAPDGVTATEVATEFDVHPNVARHHLDKLASGGHLDVAVDRTGSGAGRPSKRYRTTTAQVELDVPVRHDEVLLALLGRALTELGPERAERVAEEVGEHYGRAMAGRMDDDARRSRLSRGAPADERAHALRQRDADRPRGRGPRRSCFRHPPGGLMSTSLPACAVPQ